MQIPVYKNLEYEAKIIGPFSLRQFITFTAGAPIAFFLYKTFKETIGTDAVGLSIIPGIIAFYFGWCTPYGIPPEKFLLAFLKQKVLSPTRRIYKSDNSIENCLNLCKETPAKRKTAQENKKDDHSIA